ncbi:MAG: AAA family ATPase [Phycisphaerae bacterium]|nr:AAA family ATPase [Phycisphaerae bacterium]
MPEHDLPRLKSLLDAGHAGVFISTGEEQEALDLAFACAVDLNLPAQRWSAVNGVTDARIESGAEPHTENAAAAMFHWLRSVQQPAMLVLLDVADHLGDPRTLRALRELLEHQSRHRGCVILIDHHDSLPKVISGRVATLALDLPGEEEIEETVRRTLRDANRRAPLSIDISKRQFESVRSNLRGLTRRQIAQAVRDVVVSDNRFDAEDLPRLLAVKRGMIQGEGVLEFVDDPPSLEEVGGLDGFKGWLRQRSRAMTEEGARAGLPQPRGVLLLGVQGAGKSLAAKGVASGWRRLLVRLDAGALYDRYIGESERRLREALDQAESMSPVVLWIDEIEKAFASAASTSTDGGLSRRMFGSLLTWMQEHTAPVFLVATANDIEALPPELLRKGRFDEIFFVDLPTPSARRQILSIHLKRRGIDAAKVDLSGAIAASEGYSGAELEQGVIGALHDAFDAKERGEPGGVDGARVEAALRRSPPLSVTMAEKVSELREWARERCVAAD